MSNSKSKKIFLVDDDLDLIMQNKMILEEKGYQVITANSGKEAEQLLGKNNYDLFVVDVMMEHRTAGFSLARTINDKFPQSPIIVLSGDPDKPSWMLQPGTTWNSVRRFLDKPITPEKLLQAVEEALS